MALSTIDTFVLPLHVHIQGHVRRQKNWHELITNVNLKICYRLFLPKTILGEAVDMVSLQGLPQDSHPELDLRVVAQVILNTERHRILKPQTPHKPYASENTPKSGKNFKIFLNT